MNPTEDRSPHAVALRRKAEAIAQTQKVQSPADLAALSPEETWRMLHELRVHQIELELQNEELRHAQEELEAAKARYFDLYNMAPAGHCTLNADGIILEANRAVATLLGIAPEALVNQPLSRFLCSDDQDILYLLRKRLGANGERQECELRMVRPGGGILWVRLDAALTTDTDDTPQCRMVISDISRRKQAEEALRASEQQLQFLVDNSSDCLVIINPDGAQRYISPAAEKITGYPLAALENQPIDTLIHPDDMDAVRAAWEEAIAHPESTVTVQYRHIHKTRGWVHSEAIAQSFINDPSINGMLASVRDISERHGLEQTLRRHQDDLEAIFNATTESIHLIDAQGAVLMANADTARRLGVTAEELLGRSIFDFFPPEVASRRKEYIRQVTASGHPLKAIDQRDGRSFESSLWPIANAAEDVCRIAIFCKDVSERVAAEQALAQSQALLNVTQQLTRVGGWEWNVEQQAMTWTDETYRIHGLVPDDQPSVSAQLIDQSLACYPPEDRALVAAAFERCVASGEPYDLRVRFVAVDGRTLWVRTMAEPVWANGRIVRVRGNIMDITREVEQEQHLHIFRNIVASTTDAMAYLDQDYRYVVVNEAYERFSGRGRDHCIGMTVAQYLGEEVFLEVVKPLFDRCLQGEVINCRRWFDYPALGRRYVDLSYFPYRDDTNRITGIIAQTRDITDHIKAAEALRASEERFQAIIEACPLAVALIRDGRYHYVNPFARRLLGWKPDADLAAISIEQTIDPRYHQAIRSRIAAGASGQINPPMELMLVRPDGKRVMTESQSLPIQLPEGPAIVVMGTDITALKKRDYLVRARLRISEAAGAGSMDDLLRLILDEAEMLSDSRIGFFHFLEDDQQTVSLQTWSTSTLERFCQAEGQGPHYSVDQAGVWIDCIRQRRPVIHNDYAALPHRKGLPVGHAAVVRELLVPIFRGEKIVGVFGVGNKEQNYSPEDAELLTTLGDLAWDIVLRKRAEEALRLSEERFRTLTTLAPVGIYLSSPEGFFQYVNPRWCDMAGLSLEEAQGEGWIQGLHPDDREEILACWQKMVQSRGCWRHEYRFLTGEGKVTWVFGLATPQFDANGEIIAYIGINTDITEHKQAEAMLRESEERYRSLYDSSPDGLMLTAPDGRIISANASLCRLLGRTEAEIIQIGRSGIMDTSDPRLALALEQRTRTGRLRNVELTCVRNDGLKIPVELSSTVFQDKDGNARTSIIVHDITERKAGELLLQQQVDFTRRVLDSTAAQIAILDIDGVIIDVNVPWNRFAEENIGTVSAKIGPGASYFCPWSPEFGDTSNAAPAFEGIRQVQRGEREDFQIDYPCHSPQENRWFTMRVLPLNGAPGQVLVSHTDITPLKQTEEHLVTALAEKDVLLREVHHRVKNNLAAIIGLLDMQSRLVEDAKGRDTLTELGSRIRSMSLIHEKLYRAENLARIDFQDYLQSLLSHLCTSFGTPYIHCQAEAMGVQLPLDLAVPCGMIVNELVTNAMKHAFPKGQPAPGKEDCRLRVSMHLEDGVCTLCVADNGIGLPPDYDWTSATTLGMVLIRMLGRHQLGGSYVLDQQGGCGLTLTFNEQRGKL